MQQAIRFVQQAGAAFYTRHFSKAVYLLRRALQAVPRSTPYPQALRWALLDGVEMVESWYEGLPILDESPYSKALLQTLSEALNAPTNPAIHDQLEAFDGLLEGLWLIFDFVQNNDLSLEQNPLLLSWQLEAAGEITLYRWQENQYVDALVAEFEACFAPQLESAADYEKAVADLLTQNDLAGAEALLLQQLEQFPSNQRGAFLSLGELYFQQEWYQKAMEAYMKAVVMGTLKSQVRAQAQTACNALARNSEDRKVAARWRQVLVDFF